MKHELLLWFTSDIYKRAEESNENSQAPTSSLVRMTNKPQT